MTSEHEYVIVMTTTDSQAEADRHAAALVERRLAACVQLSPVVSHYVWDGAPTRSEEVLLLVKTRASKVEDVRAYLTEHHSYEVPEIIELPITSGHPNYLRWIDEAVEQGMGE